MIYEGLSEPVPLFPTSLYHRRRRHMEEFHPAAQSGRLSNMSNPILAVPNDLCHFVVPSAGLRL